MLHRLAILLFCERHHVNFAQEYCFHASVNFFVCVHYFYVKVVKYMYVGILFVLFVCVEAKSSSQQFFSHVGTEPPLPG